MRNGISAWTSLAAGAALVVAGCATKSQDVVAANVATTSYERMSCDELRNEASSVSARAGEVAGVQDKKAQQDAVATGVAIVVFWPALFLIKGDGETTASLSRLKGEMNAIEAASKSKKCNIQFNKA